MVVVMVGGGRSSDKLVRQSNIGSSLGGHFVLKDLSEGKGTRCSPHHLETISEEDSAGATANGRGVSQQHSSNPSKRDQSDSSLMSPNSTTPPTDIIVVETSSSGNDTSTSKKSKVVTTEREENNCVGFSEEASDRALKHGVMFATGRVVWSIKALPHWNVLALRMFDAARSGSLAELKDILASSKGHQVGLTTPHVVVTTPSTTPRNSNTSYNFTRMHSGSARLSRNYSYRDDAQRLSVVSMTTESGLDVNMEYHRPSFSEDNYFNAIFGRKRSLLAATATTCGSPLRPDPAQHEPRLLLHVAVEKGHLDIVQFLIQQGADVSVCVTCDCVCLYVFVCVFKKIFFVFFSFR